MILGRLGLDINREAPALAFDLAVSGNKPQMGGLGVQDTAHSHDLAGFDPKLLPDQHLAPERLLVVIEQLIELGPFKAGWLGQLIQNQHNGRRVAGNVRVHIVRGDQAESRYRGRRSPEYPGRGTGRQHHTPHHYPNQRG